METMQQETIQKLNQQEKPAKSPRVASVELLRSVAMLMVITLHYLDKGGILVPLAEKQGWTGYCAWLLEAFCIVAVNTYVLVSGYFLVEAGFKLRRLLNLVAQVLFYSILVPMVLVMFGLLNVQELTLYHFFNYIFPIQMNHYWFATAYIFMYMFAPLLAAGVKQMSKQQLQLTIVLVLIAFSVEKTILPIQLSSDGHGYNVIWFLCLFLVAAYMRLYGISKVDNCRKGFLLYAVCCVGIFLLAVTISYFGKWFDSFSFFATATFDYNHILCLLGAVGLFLGFLYWKMPEGKLAKIARRIAPYTFGVYLLHENREFRYLWPQLLGTDKYGNGQWSLIHWLLSVLVVFIVGIFVDYVRSLLFKGIGNVVLKIKGNRKTR